MNILGIETSCDETAAAVVADGREVIANEVYTQIPLHIPYGGVVPEIASRAHIEKIPVVIRRTMEQFKANTPAGAKIDAVAVTYGPGLAPALIVGLNAAKGLALSLKVPLFGVNHMEAHLHTPFLYDRGDEPGMLPPAPESLMPALGLAVSGGHTCWIDMPEYGRYEIVGQTLDDAAGEAFDKAAKLLGLGYPGGPKIDKLAQEFLSNAAGRGEKIDLIKFPQGRVREGVAELAGLPAELCVSFSGLKTALLRHVQKTSPAQDEIPRIVASYQEAIVEAIATRTRNALKRRSYRALVVGGGVSLNSRIRRSLKEIAERSQIPLLLAKPKYCGDNGAMIAAMAYYRRNLTGADAMGADVRPSLEAGEEP